MSDVPAPVDSPVGLPMPSDAELLVAIGFARRVYIISDVDTIAKVIDALSVIGHALTAGNVELAPDDTADFDHGFNDFTDD